MLRHCGRFALKVLRTCEPAINPRFFRASLPAGSENPDQAKWTERVNFLKEARKKMLEKMETQKRLGIEMTADQKFNGNDFPGFYLFSYQDRKPHYKKAKKTKTEKKPARKENPGQKSK